LSKNEKEREGELREKESVREIKERERREEQRKIEGLGKRE
jgi:hypothetical protein